MVSVLRTNLTSTFLLVRAAEAMLRAAKGAVVTIASSRARMSEPNTESYSASKGGLVALTHALAISLGPDIRVNCISPGWILTKGPEPTEEEHEFHPMPPCCASNAIERRANLLQQGRSGRRQHNPTIEALEQDRGTEPVLKQRHMAADRAVRHPEFERRILEAAMASSGLERANRIQRRQEAFVRHWSS